MDVTTIRSVYAFNRWVNEMLLAEAEKLIPEQARQSAGASFDTVHNTLAHMLGAEVNWLTRWQGGSTKMLGGDDFADLAAVRARWAEQNAAMDAFLASLTEERLAGPVSYTTTNGTTYTQPLWQLMLHMVNHGTHHRSELCEMLTRAGHPPPQTDMVHYFRSVAKS